MRMHSDTFTRADFSNAAAAAGVGIITLTEHGSQSRKRAFNFSLTGSSAYRTQWNANRTDERAATWDEWGIFLAHLFRIDPAAHCGKNSYLSEDHFIWSTGGRFTTLTPAGQHKRHIWDQHHGLSVTGSYAMNGCRCGAIQRWVMHGRSWAEICDTADV